MYFGWLIPERIFARLAQQLDWHNRRCVSGA